MNLYKVLRPAIFKSDPEDAHQWMAGRLRSIHRGSSLEKVAKSLYQAPPRPIEVAGISFRNPLGIAAGFDKNAEFYNGLTPLGIGFVELGSVTRYPQKGNPRPRIARLVEDQAVINHMGLNNVGIHQFIENIRKHPPQLRIGVSIAPNHDLTTAQMIADMAFCSNEAAPFADYLSLNLSCPNQDGVTSLQEPDTIGELLDKISTDNPIFCKFSSDLGEKKLFACLDGIRGKVAGIIMANTSLRRDDLQSPNRDFRGGLSGKPLFNRILAQVILIKEQYKDDFAIIFSGGVFTSEDALLAREAGADLIQIYSGMIYEGPGIFKKLGATL